MPRKSYDRRASRIGPILVVAWLLGMAPANWAADSAQPTLPDDYFEQHIRPVLVAECYSCHSSEASDLKAGLRLDDATGWQAGGDSGPALTPSDPDNSLLLKALRHDPDVVGMPPEKEPLPAEVIEQFRTWIAAGAPGGTTVAPARPDAKATHWAFQPPQLPAIPPSDTLWSLTRLDRLVEAKQVEQGMRPAAEADRAIFLRRLKYDLLGLPPTSAEMLAFVRSTAADPHQAMIDHWLASPHFGERWARVWMDVARYADTKGYVFQEDRNYAEAFRYRDWVIRSFNQDRPYDEFLQYQLAADQLAPQDANELAAMGFLTLGRRFLNNPHDIIDDRIDVVSRGLMGLTVGCARCHSHKFDPIPIEDYYSLYGVFASSEEPGSEPSKLRLVDRAEPVTPVVFVRGNPGRPGEQVPRQFLEVLAGPERQPFQRGSGRLELSQAITDPRNPLTARVLVNRVWGRLMGRYLVDTPSDFGVRSPQPVQAAVLDYLAVEFMRHDWSIKWLVREIVSSATYRQSAQASDTTRSLDPENNYFARMQRRRLDFEALRDSILFVSGLLQTERIGGPSIDIQKDDGERRRTVYAFIDRQNVPGLFRVFDVASSDTHSPKRYETIVPQQALFLLNSPFAERAAVQLADQAREQSSNPADAVQHLYRQVLARAPADWEQARSLQFLATAGDDESRQRRWRELAQVLFLSNEFIFLD